ncbi:cytochrome c-type biogenesis protein [Clostridium tetanomorphum]|uniref:Cytochrome C biogenesis protein CcdA n=1 Tax=Clostridium tetanomorphum TaxID=1553 RepID=A0A923EB01_CLOTT|nr:cytochrome c biogenesis protein CcdA [Clostridium tetanomorphum]KAJ53086.1 cytochrome c-type biogenesis protein ccdA [Clostridium tetanomorphum DSM 665]MBC2398376.1 cytochrome C biogenesis protein CcdA [Clostridium tetanomorphum]MBP1865529.1 cytochrome c-type biogenesis protein [Clostridium tetanomorphum]NRS86475.1 cytochrome c-type biogenesis protein [Clostridium tetanomorphum]NRZ95496.1 cytochrome c-type biogenesis protein [Clostridium tetanomorphum]
MDKDISLILAFASGVLSFLSPCVLPLVPMYLTYLTGTALEDINKQKDKITVIYKAIGFTIGFSIIFILMGVSITSLGKIFIANRNILRKIGGILIIIFGIHTTGLFKIKAFFYEKRLLDFNKFKLGISSIIMGMAFAIGWTPCIGPVLTSILIYASNEATLYKGIMLLLTYSLGLAIPFILSAFLVDSISKYIRKVYRYFNIISIISGIILIAMGIMTFIDKTYILNNIFS